ncbi:MAG: murein hydrolase activator EnvC family protein [Gaiellaceae bacterium]
MGRKALLTLLAILCLAAPAAAGDIHGKKAQIDAQLAATQAKLAAAKSQESKLNAQIADVSAQIGALEGSVRDVSARLSVLERDLALHKVRLAKLTALFNLETRRVMFLRRQYDAALSRLNKRVVAIYESDDPTTIDVLLSSKSFTDMVQQLDYLGQIGNQDKAIARAVAEARARARAARNRTASLRNRVSSEYRTVAYRTYVERGAQARLLGKQQSLAGARTTKQQALAAMKSTEAQFIAEANALQASSAAITAQIQGAHGTSDGTPASPSAAGLIWPAAGPVTSPFGMRWGRMHDGIDIGAPMGAPIHAAASGTVIYAGWMPGYGNLTVIDHGGGIATAYGHQSSLEVSVGDQVTQGQQIGLVGSTGHSTGPHLHFEVRVNGAPVDPMGYLP